jgi:pimeloyl-ACP methyl ester carboxylesterase
MTSIDVRGLTKRYGPLTVVDDLSFTVPAGQVTIALLSVALGTMIRATAGALATLVAIVLLVPVLEGNGAEVDFVPDYRIPHGAGYHVLAYDLRNHGLSGAANGGIGSSGIFEARDVVGSLRYVRSRPDTRELPIGLFSRCLGANATFAAMTQFPEAFAQVRSLVAVQPLTTRVILERQLALAGVPEQRIDDGLMADLSRRMVLTTSIGLPRRAPVEWARNVTVPAFLVQVHDDVLTDPNDVRAMFDAVPGDRKRLHWVRETTRRWDGYLEFQRRPEPVLDWLGTTVATVAEPVGR